jgi:hypothetical protein
MRSPWIHFAGTRLTYGFSNITSPNYSIMVEDYQEVVNSSHARGIHAMALNMQFYYVHASEKQKNQKRQN